MSFESGYRGTINSPVQAAYTDHPELGVAGMLAFASDQNEIDTFLVGEPDGIPAGIGVELEIYAQGATDYQTPAQRPFLPNGTEVPGNFGGILVYDEGMQSDENGIPGWAFGRNSRVLMPKRGGGRIYVKAVELIEIGDSVNWCIVAATAGILYQLGEFSPSALGGGVAGTSVVISNTVARWVRGAEAGSLAILELLGTYVAPPAT